MGKPTVTAATGGTGQLALLSVVSLQRANAGLRGFRIDAVSTIVKASTGFRLQSDNTLLSLDSGSARDFRAASRDTNGMWSEFSAVQSFTCPNFTAGASEVSLQSAATTDGALCSGVNFPDLAKGSGKMKVFRTLVSQSDAWTDEVRASRYARGQAAFSVKLEQLDNNQSHLLHRFWRALGGPQRAFFFDWVNPADGNRLTAPSQRYLVRFRDPSLADSLFGTTLTDMAFTLTEVLDDPEGGDV